MQKAITNINHIKRKAEILIMRNAVINSIVENKLIAIIRGIDSDKLIDTVTALYNGGIRLVEVTFDRTKAVSDKETALSIGMLASEFAGKMYIGAGTVTDVEQVRLVKEAGGSFIISPDTFEDVIKKTVELGMVSIPGALTPTEITTAARAGADFVKLFPVGNLGVSYVKAVKAPLRDIKLLAVGGIDENNIREYASSGVLGFGIGSGIIKKSLIDSGSFDKITELAKIYVEAVK